MIYSVWDHADRIYKYYESPERSADTSAPKPKHLRPRTLGESPEDAAWPLPSSAKLVGKGKYPKGRIASRESGKAASLGVLPEITPVNMVLAGALGFMAWHFIKKGK